MRIGAEYFASCAAFLSILLAFGCSKQSPNTSSGRTEPRSSSFRASGGTNGVLERGPGGEGRSAEQGYTVSGQAFYKTLVVDRQFSFDFRLSVKKDRWGMEFTAIPFDGVRHIQNCDGSNLVAITYLKKAKDARAWNDGYVIVDNRNTPMGEPFVAHVVFVAFAGQFYLPAGTNGLLCPLWHPEREVNHVAFVNSDWQLMAPGRAEIIRCWHEAQKWNEILKKPRGSGSGKTDQKALLAIYSAVSKTNFGGEIFPAAYAFKAFAPDREDGKDESSPVYEIQITNVVFRAAIDEQLFERTFKGVAVVDDYRGLEGGLFSYNITNTALPRLPQGTYVLQDAPAR
jgi:hypothetical protein